MKLLAPISMGELVDKITILQIKSERIDDAQKLKNVMHELVELTEEFHRVNKFEINELVLDLKKINSELWDIEDFKRSCEKTQSFGNEFIYAARQVYLKNDERAKIKKEINLICGSDIVEEKSYK